MAVWRPWHGFNDKLEKAELIVLTGTKESVPAGGTAQVSISLSTYGIADATKYSVVSVMCGGDADRLVSAIVVKNDTVYPNASLIQGTLGIGVFNADDGSAQDIFWKVVLAPIE